jgi:hypothetical protein
MKIDAGDVRIGLYNFFIIGIMALLFIVVAKMVTTKFPVRGITEVVHSA